MQARKTPRVSTVADLLDAGRRRLRTSHAIDHWRAAIAAEDAADLLGLVLGITADELDPDATVPARAEVRFHQYVERRAAGEPVALIRGAVDFAGLTLLVRPGVFVPRGSSELLARSAVAALRRRRTARVAVDVACGAGPVTCAVARAVPGAEVWGLDIDPAAVRLARANARRNHLANARFRVSDLLAGLPRRLRGGVAVLTIHPPYVARGEMRGLPAEIREFEPRHTLTDGSDDGLGLVRLLTGETSEWLRPDGALLVEVAPYLSRSVQGVMRRSGLHVTVLSEPGGITRVVSGVWRG
ncbi:MAG: HemK/PrmC family methyltransferase [Candidatus Dormibacteria bacterium]|jgi:release factor glutamine methyltransferase